MKIGIIGVGRWGKNLLRNFDSVADCDIVWLCDHAQITGIEDVGYSGRFTRDYREVLNDPEVDAVAIATPIPTHYQLASESIDSSKHVFSEKPLAMDTAQAEELTEAASTINKVLFVDYLMRYSSGVTAVHEAIGDNRIGTVQTATFTRLHVPRVGEYPDVIADLLPHDISIMEKWFGGVPSSVKASKESSVVGAADKEPESAQLEFQYESGVSVSVQLSRVSDARQRTVEVVGDSGSLVWDESDESVRVCRLGSSGSVESIPYEYSPPLLSACEKFVELIGEAVRPVDNLPISTAAIFNAIDAGSEEQRWVQVNGVR